MLVTIMLSLCSYLIIAYIQYRVIYMQIIQKFHISLLRHQDAFYDNEHFSFQFWNVKDAKFSIIPASVTITVTIIRATIEGLTNEPGVKLRELPALLLSQTQRRDVNAAARECE